MALSACEQLDTASQIRAASLAGCTVDPHEIEKKACGAYCLGALPIDVVGELFSETSVMFELRRSRLAVLPRGLFRVAPLP